MPDASVPLSVSSPPVRSPRPAPRVRLDYLDGLRGIAALYVVFHHALMEIDFHLDGAGLPSGVAHAVGGLLYGQIGVDIFIVLSGYCLMLPIARSDNGALRGGLGAYFVRRARRILPPYFAVLAACLALLRLFPWLTHASSVRWPGNRDPFSPFHLLSHVLLIHNWDRDAAVAIDYPMWSVASEWQIYFLFPLVLLPLGRRFGSLVPVLAGFAFGFVCWRWLPQTSQACPWFVGLFALGMAGANVSFSPAAGAMRRRARLPWGTGAAAFAVAALVLSYLQIHRHDIPTIVTDALIGAAAACFLVSATRCLTDPGQFAAHWGLRLCASRGAVRLGTFSYSLYLVHAPVVAIVHNIAGLFALPPVGVLLALFAFGVPLSLAAGYVFYRLFERPFLPGHPRSDAEAAQAAVVSPAP